jgi:hemerythrin-like domain-containing protein
MNVHIREVSQADSQRLERCIVSLRANHDLKLSMCDALEAIADGLPDQLDIQTCLTLSRCLLPTVKKAQALEEEELFPLLLRLTGNHPALAASVERLHKEHCEDECFAEEISHLLEECASEGKAGNAEVAGYMLRGFFSAVRRHVAFERECLLSLATSAGGFGR